MFTCGTRRKKKELKKSQSPSMLHSSKMLKNWKNLPDREKKHLRTVVYFFDFMPIRHTQWNEFLGRESPSSTCQTFHRRKLVQTCFAAPEYYAAQIILTANVLDKNNIDRFPTFSLIIVRVLYVCHNKVLSRKTRKSFRRCLALLSL